MSGPRVRVVVGLGAAEFEVGLRAAFAELPRAELHASHGAVYTPEDGYGQRFVGVLVERPEPAVRHVVDGPHPAADVPGEPLLPLEGPDAA